MLSEHSCWAGPPRGGSPRHNPVTFPAHATLCLRGEGDGPYGYRDDSGAGGVVSETSHAAH